MSEGYDNDNDDDEEDERGRGGGRDLNNWPRSFLHDKKVEQRLMDVASRLHFFCQLERFRKFLSEILRRKKCI